MLTTAAALTAGYAASWGVRHELIHHEPAPATPTPAAYLAAGASPSAAAAAGSGAQPRAAALAAALAQAVSDRSFGGALRARVVDVLSGAVLYDRGGALLGAPASSAKLLTAAALFTVHAPTDRLMTRVVAGPGAAVVLVGGGDPTLTGAPAGQSGAYPEAARITDLAAQLRAARVRPTSVIVDDSLFAGPSISPAWAPEDVPSEYGAPITAVMVDGGRITPNAPLRSAQPDLDAGQSLATALGLPGLKVTRGASPPGARQLAQVSSAPLSTLVEQMLQNSDNVIAECLARQVALAEGLPATFTGAARALRRVLAGLGLDPGPGMVDGSGLAAGDRLSAGTLAALVRVVADGAHPGLQALLTGLPIAAWSGTLGTRYLAGPSHAGAGVVRAKTGTLTGVSALVGLVHDRSGRLLAFAFMAENATDAASAEAALDVIAARLAECGCI
jgi:D-alanyl-D-alanine carboxypeptidase/D-alanyl-D-alanine-endopeptidase (penicillin-binding protein 4)